MHIYIFANLYNHTQTQQVNLFKNKYILKVCKLCKVLKVFFSF